MSDISQDPREDSRPRRRINLAAIVIGLMVAFTPEPANAIVVGLLAGLLLFTVKWVWYRWTIPRDEV
jgi:hypothetical protein